VWSELEGSRRRKDLARRMAAPQWNEPAQPQPDLGASKSSTTLVPQALADTAAAWAGGTVTESLEQRLERAGLPVTPGEFLVGSAAAALVGVIVFGWIPYIVLRRKESKRIEQLHEQLPDVLMILASSLRAGHSFLQALDTASKEIGAPSGPEFSRVVTEIRLGRQPHDALNTMAERIGTEEFKWAMLGINVQREVGGNLAEILDILAETVRDRDAVRRQVRVLSAEARLSMKIMIALPPLMVLYMVAVNRSYMRLLWTTRAGWIMIAAGCTLMAIGIVMMRKLVKVDV
jgi:tight adherence protein B